MISAHVVITLTTVAMVGFVAVADLLRAPFVLENARAVGVPDTWLTPLGLAKGAGAVGLVLGLTGATPLGVVAGAGLTAFFVGAVVTHLRVGDRHLAFPLAFLVLAATTLGSFLIG